MARYRAEVTHESRLPVAQAFAALSEHDNLSRVFGIPVRRIRDGDTEPNGVGSVRALGLGPLATQETVLAVVPNASIDYQVTKFGGPIRNHHGRIAFAGTRRGSRVTWTITFVALPVVGNALKALLETLIARGLRRMG